MTCESDGSSSAQSPWVSITLGDKPTPPNVLHSGEVQPSVPGQSIHSSQPMINFPPGLGPALPPRASHNNWHPKQTPKIFGRTWPGGTFPCTRTVKHSINEVRHGKLQSSAEWWLPVITIPFKPHISSMRSGSPLATCKVVHASPFCCMH
jgi:hypothetical protein